ncbi:PREDICTED: uncharacterized protein LOC106105298, partial [Papilio polytes]|uniref:uncharacterized protein LOC106105298 n=1 Tax=Papilio polytes TaxID=76194 RepID=UPI000675FBFD
MSSNVGNITPFHHKSQEWHIFKSRLKMFLKINGGLKGNENAVLLTHLTEKTYRLVRNLLYPRIIEDATFDELVSVLDAAQALEVAQQTACARQARAIMVDAGMKQEPMFKVSDGVRRRGAGVASSSRSPQDPSVCSVCGKTNHSSNRCRFRNYTCKNCGQRSHLAIMCGKKKSASKLYNLDEDSPSKAEVTECPDCDLFNLRYVTNDPLHLEVEISNHKMNMELDIGS